MRAQIRAHGFWWFLAAVLSVLASGIGTAGYLYYVLQKERIKHQVENQLSAVTELKVNEISE